MNLFVKSAFLTALLSGTVIAQSTSGRDQASKQGATSRNLRFEVATIKPSGPDSTGGPGEMGHRVTMPATTILFLIGFAYDLQDRQIVGAPSWASSEKYDIDGVSGTAGDPDLEQIKEMLRNLLVDRFQLRVHTQQHQLPAYVLSVTSKGSKLTASSEALDSKPGLLMEPGFPKVASMKGVNLSMSEFARLLQSGILDRPVLDQTGLKGRYDFQLKWTPDESQFRQVGVRVPVPSDSADAPPLVTAVQEQLGLRLILQRQAPVPVDVIDRIEKPSEN